MNSLLKKKLVVDEQQQEKFDTDGFFILPNALTSSHIDELLRVVDRLYTKYKHERKLSSGAPFQMRNIVSVDPIFKSLMIHEKMLSIADDVFGYNIQLRTSHMDIRPPMKRDHNSVDLGSTKSFFPWHSDQPDFGWPIENGMPPGIDFLSIFVDLGGQVGAANRPKIDPKRHQKTHRFLHRFLIDFGTILGTSWAPRRRSNRAKRHPKTRPKGSHNRLRAPLGALDRF